MLEPGKLKHRVTIQSKVQTQDSETGEMIVTWIDDSVVWAAIEPLSAREFIASQAEASKVTGKIIIRYRSDIDYSMRLYHSAKDIYYNIEGILSDKDSGLEYITIPVSQGLRFENTV